MMRHTYLDLVLWREGLLESALVVVISTRGDKGRERKERKGKGREGKKEGGGELR